MKLINPSVPKYRILASHIKEILNSKELTTGKWTKKVEDKIKEIHKCKYCLLLSSASTAFMLLLSAVNKNIKYSKTVIQDFTWESIKQIVTMMNNIYDIEYCDINNNDWIAEEPEDKDCLFIPNMTFGNVKTFKHKKTIYDSSHCLGNKECNGRGLGEIISFSPAKIITGCEAGCIITNNKKIYNECLELRKYHGRVSELNALFLYYNLDNLKEEQTRKYNIWQLYKTNLNHTFKTWSKNKFSTSIYPSEFVYTHSKMTPQIRKKLEKIFPIRLRYKPINNKNLISKYIYNHQIVLPQINKKEQMEVINILNTIVK